MLLVVRYYWRWFALFAVLGVALRLLFVWKFPLVEGDSLIYGDIAKNWLLHGVYGVSDGEVVRPTLIRLPGYPALLAACFRVFGMEHYRAVMLVQTAMDMGTAWIVGAIAREVWMTAKEMGEWAQEAGRRAHVVIGRGNAPRAWGLPPTAPERATIFGFGLYCVFPYTANFVSQPLAETPTLFAICLALWLAMRGLRSGSRWEWLGCALATVWCVVLRPDGGLLLITLLAYLAWRRAWKPAVLLVVCTALALTPWTVRNHRVFGLWQPLVPGNATDPGEFFPQGFTDWTKTWLGEFCSVYEIAWNVPGDTIDAGLLPSRAFDSEVQKQRTLEVINEYNATQQVSADLDAKFAQLARERKAAHPVMYYVELPLMREVDMWLRPRTDTFPIEVRWWEWWRVPKETVFAATYAGLGVVVLIAGVLGYLRNRRAMQFAGLLVLYAVLRSVFLLTVATSEPRYTLECWPMVLVFAAASIARVRHRISAT